MAKASHGVWQGKWYFEVQKCSSTGNCRYYSFYLELDGLKSAVIYKPLVDMISLATLSETLLVLCFINLKCSLIFPMISPMAMVFLSY
jgi:hypothetical protein